MYTGRLAAHTCRSVELHSRAPVVRYPFPWGMAVLRHEQTIRLIFIPLSVEYGQLYAVFFVLLSLTFGVALAVINSAIPRPDESAHLLRAYRTARGELVPSTRISR